MDLLHEMHRCIKCNATDIHISVGKPVRYRSRGDILSFSEAVTQTDFNMFIDSCGVDIRKFSEDFSTEIFGKRMRGNYYKSYTGDEVALRVLAEVIPELDTLDLAESVRDIIGLRRGLVLVTGITGSGKSTTLASIINEINKTHRRHIITVENPIEYIYQENLCKISQREVGKHVASFEEATIDAMREDPDILLLGELRDLRTIQAAVSMAETGHLVLGTLHTRNAVESVDRMVDVFPAEQQTTVRSQICSVLAGVISQTLVKSKTGMYCLQEVLYPESSIRSALKESKSLNQIRTSMMMNKRNVLIMESGVRGIIEKQADPIEIWVNMDLENSEKKTFIQRLRSANAPEECIELIENYKPDSLTQHREIKEESSLGDDWT